MPVKLLVSVLLSASPWLVAATVPAAETSPLPTTAAASTSSPAIEAIRTELEAMLVTDQSLRHRMAGTEKEHGPNSPEMAALWKEQKPIDAHNLERLEAIIAAHGWPRRSVFGEKAASAAFLILQHSDLSHQKKYLPLARAAAEAKEMSGSSLALLEDRILDREGKGQIYGSQVHRNEAGEWEALPIEDEAHVDERRAKVGLGPLAAYLQGFADRGGGKVHDPKSDLPSPSAPPLTQTIFDAADNAKVACAKLEATPAQGGESGLQFQFACRDFCQRFPSSPSYGTVRVLAANRAGWIGQPEQDRLGDWDPMDAERDPRLSAEQRAEVAMLNAGFRADRSPPADFKPGTSEADVEFDGVVAALPAHKTTYAAKHNLMRVALNVTPSKAIPVLGEFYPDDSDVAAVIRALQAIGQPCELRFPAFDGRAVDLKDYRGKVVLVYFWTGDPTEILVEIKRLADAQAAKDLVVIGISLDEDRAQVEKVIAKNGLTWPVFHDGKQWESAPMKQFVIKTLPYSLLIDRQGALRFRSVNALSAETKARIEMLLAEKTGEKP